ncbi:S8 family serine peptidase [Candidatus Poribacteria bacterium]|nr:S8 family serine peptidase [Candidatus Poribacteria bacterium]
MYSRKFAALFLFITIISFQSLCHADSYTSLQKLDPVLKKFVIKDPTPAVLSAPAVRSGQDDYFNAIIKFNGSPTYLGHYGVNIRTIIGNFATADIPINSIRELIKIPEIIHIQVSRRMMPKLLDKSVPDTRSDQVWQSNPAYTGKGVIVGVIDQGVDWSHPDLRNEDGSSRILYLWDQTMNLSGRYPRDFGYGTEWTKEQIDKGQCKSMDATSHGTHIASTMAGNSRGKNNFNGVAPEADIIVVKTSYFDDADVIDAANYIFLKADEMGKPAVINMSFGSQWGPHDGTSFLDQALNEFLYESGRAIVASAGNDGGSPIHVGTNSLRRNVGENYPWTAIQPSIGTQSILIQIWYKPEDDLSVRVLLPENNKGDLSDLDIGWVGEEQYQEFKVSRGPLNGAQVLIDTTLMASPFLYPNFNGIYIHINTDDNLNIPLDDYIYAIEYDGPGLKIDAYLVWQGYFINKLPDSISHPNESFLLSGDGNKTIISPSSASQIISVGSYITRSEWIDYENRIRDENLIVGNLSAFSSRGPLLDGSRKPDITGPGEMIVAAFSSDSWNTSKRIYKNGEYISWRGTSMSSPHVAGAIALLYEQNPELTSGQVKNILNRTALDQGPAGWDKAWGYGKLDTLAAIGIPARPRNFRLNIDDGAVTVRWTVNKESDIAGYKINIEYTKEDNEIVKETLEIAHPVSSYRISELPKDAQIFISMTAYDSDGNESPVTDRLYVILDELTDDNTPPQQPQDLTVISINKALEFSWSANKEHDLSRYKIYYGKNPGEYENNIFVGKSDSYRLENLENNVRYYAAVSAVDTSGNESDMSKEVSSVPRLSPQTTMRYQSGWPVSVNHDLYSSPVLYDVDNDGRLETIISSRDGKIHLVRYNGKYLSGWPKSLSSSSVLTPSIGDVNGDGDIDIIAASSNTLYVWDIRGRLLTGWPVNFENIIISSPALVDLNSDGDLDIVISLKMGAIYAFDGYGRTLDGWPIIINGHINSSAAVGDIDNDLQPEVIFSSENGMIYVFQSDGRYKNGWPVRIGSSIKTSPSVGDLDGDGDLEIIQADDRQHGRVYVYNYSGNILDGWPVNVWEKIDSSPVLGDVDGDKTTLETVFVTQHGSIYVIRNDGSIMENWPVSIMNTITSSPSLGDIDGDGETEIITSSKYGYEGLVYAFDNSGNRLDSRWPLYTQGGIINSSPALGDLDGDGDIEIVVGSSRTASDTGGYIHAWDLSGRPDKANIVWGGFRHDHMNSGFASDMVPPSFVIVPLQNSALRNYVNIYIVSSENLLSNPEISIYFQTEGNSEKQTILNSLPLNYLDPESGTYSINFNIVQDGNYTFTVAGVDTSENSGSSTRTLTLKTGDEEDLAPENNRLLANYPNPFNPGTWIPYELNQNSDVTIEIYNNFGQLIRFFDLGYKSAGFYLTKENAVYWDGKTELMEEAAAGVYFYVMKAGDFTSIRKMLLVK